VTPAAATASSLSGRLVPGLAVLLVDARGCHCAYIITDRDRVEEGKRLRRHGNTHQQHRFVWTGERTTDHLPVLRSGRPLIGAATAAYSPLYLPVGWIAPDALSARLRDPQLPIGVDLGAAPASAVAFAVHGPAATKGSTRAFPSASTGAIVTVADAKRLPAWTQAVAWSAKAARVPLMPRPRGVALAVWFLFIRPSSVSAGERPLMTVKPDLDKCLRAALDALTGIAYEDDAQVIDVHVRKRYGSRTETIVQVWEVPSESAVVSRTAARRQGDHG